ncbi:cupin [Candidatus Daviesbacteria bacterium]|nr:cupin [Candidatus Daviesbacteria bacterium]
MVNQALDDFLKTLDKGNFTNAPYIKKVEKPWGYELIFTPDNLPYTGKIIHINSGKRLSLQVHDKKQESYFLANGECNLIIENSKGNLETIKMEKGVGYTMLVGQKHRHQAVTDCDVFEVSTPESGNTYRLEDDFARSTETEEIRKDPNRGWST